MDARKRFRLSLILVMALSACATPPPPPPKPTTIAATLDANANVNPDMRGRPSPVVVRFYELKALAAFNSADFFALNDRDKDTLGSELVAREEFVLQPGDKRPLARTLQADTRFIGVVAAYRDLERAQWRASAPVPLNQASTVTVSFDDRKVSISLR